MFCRGPLTWYYFPTFAPLDNPDGGTQSHETDAGGTSWDKAVVLAVRTHPAVRPLDALGQLELDFQDADYPG